jgi:hypothetical protein
MDGFLCQRRDFGRVGIDQRLFTHTVFSVVLSVLDFAWWHPAEAGKAVFSVDCSDFA